MAYELEDEVDWSDGSFGSPVLARHETMETEPTALHELDAFVASEIVHTQPQTDEQHAEAWPNRHELALDHYSSGELRQVSHSQRSETLSWKIKLIKDHKRRLAKKWPCPKQLVQNPALDPKSAIGQAVARGLLKPPRQQVVASRKANPDKAPRKKRKTTSNGRVQPLVNRSASARTNPHSTFLGTHHSLPPEAYFISNGEKPAWRCGVNHAMGRCYNAGDRRNCVGCFTSVAPKHNSRLKWMDFYLPSRTYFYQPSPGTIWHPSKETSKSRRSQHLSHNSIAKDAFYAAIKAGATDDEARQKGIEAIEEHLRPKTQCQGSTLTPTPEPPPVDLGLHPSGSMTMEHGQDIPECAYWEKNERDEAYAWRCDVNHALGRYYIAGSKKYCPGCGSNSTGKAKHSEMDFYLPRGVVVRQEAPGLSKWQPRKPYNRTSARKQTKYLKKPILSHNQICSNKYWAFVEAGMGHEDALRLAVEDTDAYLDAQFEVIRRKIAREDEQEDPSTPRCPSETSSSSPRGLISTLVPRKRGHDESEDSSADESSSGSDSQ